MNNLMERTLEENVKEFECWCNDVMINLGFYLTFTEWVLKKNLQDEIILSEQEIANEYKALENELNEIIYELVKKAEELMVPTELRKCNIENFQKAKESLARSMKDYTDAFKKLEQELEAE